MEIQFDIIFRGWRWVPKVRGWSWKDGVGGEFKWLCLGFHGRVVL